MHISICQTKNQRYDHRPSVPLYAPALPALLSPPSFQARVHTVLCDQEDALRLQDESIKKTSEVLALYKTKGQACIGKNLDKIDSHLLNLII